MTMQRKAHILYNNNEIMLKSFKKTLIILSLICCIKVLANALSQKELVCIFRGDSM